MTETSAFIDHTKKWLSTVIIDHQLCPFAKREFDLDCISYRVIESPDVSIQLERLFAECQALDADPNLETSLLIFPEGLSDYFDYLDVLDIATNLMTAQGYEGIYQLASFHPDYCFEGVDEDNPSHYTNRSPYPMLHILREASVEAVLKSYPNPEKIPERNIALTQFLGLEVMKALLSACYK